VQNKKLMVALIQQSCSGSCDENLNKSLKMLAEAASKGAKLIIFQELHRSLYFCQQEDVNNFNLAESIPGPSTERLSEAAKQYGVVIVASLFEKRAPGVHHNTAVVFESDGKLLGKYRKMHIPDDPGYYEKFYFTPGDLGFKPIMTSVANLGVLVCWDQWFPEAARLMAMNGADLLIYPTAIGWHPPDEPQEKKRQREAWITIQRAHSIANGLTVLSVNRVGHEADLDENKKPRGPGIDFWGSSFASDPQGEILQMASEAKEEVVLVEVDLARTEEVRRIWPFFRDRRIDAYGGLCARWLDG